jgi:hypothetical protein
MRLVAGAITLVLAIPSTAAAQPSGNTGQPDNAGCFGELASTGGEAGVVGEFVRANADRYKDSEESIGNTGVPFLKSLACPGDNRGREPSSPVG